MHKPMWKNLLHVYRYGYQSGTDCLGVSLLLTLCNTQMWNCNFRSLIWEILQDQTVHVMWFHRNMKSCLLFLSISWERKKKHRLMREQRFVAVIMQVITGANLFHRLFSKHIFIVNTQRDYKRVKGPSGSLIVLRLGDLGFKPLKSQVMTHHLIDLSRHWPLNCWLYNFLYCFLDNKSPKKTVF